MMPDNVSKYDIPGCRALSQIGTGNSGTVFKVEDTSSEVSSTGDARKASSSRFAAKVIPAHKVTASVRREVELHLRLTDQSPQHRNIVALRRVAVAHEAHSGKPALALIMDHANAGDMFVEVTSAGCLPASVVRRRLFDIASALSFLHRNNVVHLDVKLENVVVDNLSVAKLTDFGCARTLSKQTKTGNGHSLDDGNIGVDVDSLCFNVKEEEEEEEEQVEYSLGGTVDYLSPEVVNDKFRLPTPAMDAWALGVLAYTSLVGAYPFGATQQDHDQNRKEHDCTNSCDEIDDDDDDDDVLVKNRILNQDPHAIPSYISIPSDLHRIVFGLLDKNPSTRMTVDQALDILRETASARPSLRSSRYAHLVSSQARRQYRSSYVKSTYQAREVMRTRSPSPTSPIEADFSSSRSSNVKSRVDEAEKSRRVARLQSAIAALDDVVNATRTPTKCHLSDNFSRVNSRMSNCSYSTLSTDA